MFRSIFASLFAVAVLAAPAAAAPPVFDPRPISNVLAPGTSSVDLTVRSLAATTCAYSVGSDRPFAQMTPFAQGAGTTSHRTVVPINADSRVVNDVFVRSAAAPDSVLRLKYRARANSNPRFPRIGNLWGFGEWKYSAGLTLAERARVDLWLGADVWSPSELPSYASDFYQLRTLNPHTLLLASMNAVEPYTSAIPESYFLHTTTGARIEVWPGSYRLNLTKPEVAAFQAQWAYDRLAESGFIHDGIFVDNVFLSQSWQTTDIYGNPVAIDADDNGIADDPATLDAAWRAGVLDEIEAIRGLMPDILMSGHALDENEPRILAAFNGISVGFEAANAIEGEQGFSSVLHRWNRWAAESRGPRINMHEGSPIDLFAYGYDYDPLSKVRPSSLAFARGHYPWMRFALGLTLLEDGWYAYEWGDTYHGNAWWYDEYDFDLGTPTGAAAPVNVGFDPGPNLIVNAGFEQPLAEPWGGWVDTGGGYAGAFTRDLATAHTGAASARVVVTAAPGEAWRIEFRQDARTLVAGVSYELSFWAKASAPRPITVSAQQNAPPWNGYGLYQRVDLDTPWQRFTVPFTATATGSDVRIQFLVGATTGTVWLDDVQLTRRAPDVWRRDFTNGIVLVNGTAASQTVSLGAGYRRLVGAQAPRVQAVVDDSASAFAAVSGAWTRRHLDSGEWKAAGPFFHSWGDTLRWLASGAGEARWTLPVRDAGAHSVSVWWPAAPESSTWTASAVYELRVNGATVATRTLDQRSGGDTWQAIGSFSAAPGTPVELRLACVGPCVADAAYVESAARYNDGSVANAVVLQPWDAIVLQRDASAGVDPPGGAGALSLVAPSPNPSRGAVRFAWVLPAAGVVRLRVYDVSGRLVAEPLRGPRPAGPGAADWDGRTRAGRAAPPGVYVAELRLGAQSVTRRFVLAR